VRELNEDCIGVFGYLSLEDQRSVSVLETTLNDPCLAIVADGLGGHRGGRFASELVVRRLSSSIPAARDDVGLIEALNTTNRELHEAMQRQPEYDRMGATVAGLVLARDKIQCFNVGDSRVYEVVPGPFVRLLSTDDVPKNEDYDVSAKTGLTSHVVTQSLGGTSRLVELQPHIATRPFRFGSAFLICSDGLTDMLDQDAIEANIEEDIAVFATRLFQQAMDAGGEDNISICVVEIVQGRDVSAPDHTAKGV